MCQCQFHFPTNHHQKPDGGRVPVEACFDSQTDTGHAMALEVVVVVVLRGASLAGLASSP